MTFDDVNFTAGVKATISNLKEQGFQQEALTNTFKPGLPYMGINTTYRTPEGEVFELQFHTPSSFQVKDVVNHPLYEQQRILPDGHLSIESLDRQMIRNSSNIPIPPNVNQIKNWSK